MNIAVLVQAITFKVIANSVAKVTAKVAKLSASVRNKIPLQHLTIKAALKKSLIAIAVVC